MKPTKTTSVFGRFSKTVARATGRPRTFLLALSIVTVWAATGSIFGYSDT